MVRTISMNFSQGLLQEGREIFPALARAMARWHLAGAVHGDMKWPNILVRKGKEGYAIFFVDLDQSRLYRAPSVQGMEKDLQRFFRFGIEVGSEGLVDTGFFPEYMKTIPESLRHKINLQRIREHAYRKWRKKGQKRL